METNEFEQKTQSLSEEKRVLIDFCLSLSHSIRHASTICQIKSAAFYNLSLFYVPLHILNNV